MHPPPLGRSLRVRDDHGAALGDAVNVVIIHVFGPHYALLPFLGVGGTLAMRVIQHHHLRPRRRTVASGVFRRAVWSGAVEEIERLHRPEVGVGQVRPEEGLELRLPSSSSSSSAAPARATARRRIIRSRRIPADDVRIAPARRREDPEQFVHVVHRRPPVPSRPRAVKAIVLLSLLKEESDAHGERRSVPALPPPPLGELPEQIRPE
mmetsp:Transcript_16773/g.48298  ORF Transcript_16773/g.48298 Transcript_16773/m.48298 type:complete len:208 (+) Transcript_16773:1072-1695(+)